MKNAPVLVMQLKHATVNAARKNAPIAIGYRGPNAQSNAGMEQSSGIATSQSNQFVPQLNAHLRWRHLIAMWILAQSIASSVIGERGRIARRHATQVECGNACACSSSRRLTVERALIRKT